MLCVSTPSRVSRCRGAVGAQRVLIALRFWFTAIPATQSLQRRGSIGLAARRFLHNFPASALESRFFTSLLQIRDLLHVLLGRFGEVAGIVQPGSRDLRQ